MCPICHTGTTRPGYGDKVLTHDGATVVVQHTPAEVCDTCGERFFDSAVVRELLKIAHEAVDAGVVVDVRRYPGVAA
jgi:YgiT-type zinc finger domain-containing protein